MSKSKQFLPPASVVVTTFNESQTILLLLEALEKQTHRPAEVVLVDACSVDGTVKIVRCFADKSVLKIIVLSQAGNRSVGRNLAIRKTRNPLIAITDAGCVPEKDWLEQLVQKQLDTNAPVVAGYYCGLPKTAFEQAVIPYVLVMPDKVDAISFLPATRSMLITKAVWKKTGGFDEQLSHNEDYAFARQLQNMNISIAFAERAIVGWRPRSSLLAFFCMIYRFAFGDAEAGLFRPKVFFLFFRYVLLLLCSVVILFFLEPKFLFKLWIPLGVLYSIWAVDKHVRYVPQGWFWLPTLQFTADAAVMAGTIFGWLKKYKKTIFD
ncbi:MAG: glycosyltransferase [Candidatus Pacebacteria bacterium]|nr:glycosyltransferase [Candidatus Paceibacterota bacterium]